MTKNIINDNLLKIFSKKKVIITGHTGFKGCWLCLIFYLIGAKVVGISNSRFKKNLLFDALKIKKKIVSINCDVRNFKKLKNIIKSHKPDYIIHLAAQALVKNAFNNPKVTWETNTIGTINILEILRETNFKVITIFITSDKVYKNVETTIGYKENDRLGDLDPYSSSKASADLAIQSYFKSYLSKKKNLRLGIARAGNVIGGGDWAPGRLVPDCIKSWRQNRNVLIRNPYSTRPWQHVFDVLRGYLFFAANLNRSVKLNGEAFNFGPKINRNTNVLSVVKHMKKLWGSKNLVKFKKVKFKEANLLSLNSSKSKLKLQWQPKMSLKDSLKLTIKWYKQYYLDTKGIEKFSVNSIKYFISK